MWKPRLDPWESGGNPGNSHQERVDGHCVQSLFHQFAGDEVFADDVAGIELLGSVLI
jgi:hypothetical protein